MIVLYSCPEIKINKNMYIDELENYLALKSSRTITLNDFQYIKHALTLSIKVNIDQDQVAECDLNYIKVSNTDESTFYYYIINREWISQSCVKFSLVMDTINSLGQDFSSSANPRNFGVLTKITREHKDRFIKPSNWNHLIGGTLLRKINQESEGLNPQKYKTNDKVINATQNKDWYLIYRSNEADAVITDLLADTSINFGTSSTEAVKVYTGADFESGYQYLFLEKDNPNGTISISGNTITLGTTTRRRAKKLTGGVSYIVEESILSKIMGVCLVKSNNNISYSLIYEDDYIFADGVVGQNSLRYGNWSASLNSEVDGNTLIQNNLFKEVTNVTISAGIKFIRTPHIYTNTSYDGLSAVVGSAIGINVGSAVLPTLSINDIDRTDSRLIKIIRLPYCPVNYTYLNNSYQFDDDWQYRSGYIRYIGTGLPDFTNYSAINDTLENIIFYDFYPSELNDNETKNKAYESNLYHSDYYTIKYLYDSFSTSIPLEHLNFGSGAGINGKITFDFKPTNTINSKMLFRLNFANLGILSESEDYQKFIVISRNNEETILNDAYINYIKNGYNYDKKQNALAVEQAQRSAITTSSGAMLSFISGLLGIALSGATGGASAVAGIGLLSGAVGGAISTSNAWQNVSDLIANQENSMAKNLAQLSAQSASVSGTDDIDLMSFYAANRLKRIDYQPTDKIKDALYNLYDLTGVSYNKTETPNVDSRIWYNYLKCTPYINYENGKLNQSWLNDLKLKYEDGVTIYHCRTKDGVKHWNLLQDYENFEKWLVDE